MDLMEQDPNIQVAGYKDFFNLPTLMVGSSITKERRNVMAIL